MKKNRNYIKESVRDNLVVGMSGVVGMKAMGQVSNMKGVPASGKAVVPIAGMGVQMASTAQMAKTGMGMMKSFEEMSYEKKKKRR